MLGDSLISPVRGTAKIFCYIYGMVAFFGVTGNSIVLYVIGYRKKRRTSSDNFILSLAIADFLSSVFAPILMLNDLITDSKFWLYGVAMCYTVEPRKLEHTFLKDRLARLL